uniref:Uncharacterized protein n=1 Tax=Geladintestivirus 4 TaxID=3233136 RepID=A0AAU8MJL2_9CAUD
MVLKLVKLLEILVIMFIFVLAMLNKDVLEQCNNNKINK